MTQIFDKELPGIIGKKIILDNGEKTEEVTLVYVKEDIVSIRLKRNDDWDGIEPWIKRPVDYIKMFIHD